MASQVSALPNRPLQQPNATSVRSKVNSCRDAAGSFAAACSLALELGCASLQPIHQPPTPAEIDEINASYGPIYVEAIPTTGSGQHAWMVDHVLFADAEKIVVAPVYGPPYAFPVCDVSNFHLRDTGRGAAIGAGWGALVGAVGGGYVALLVTSMGEQPGRETFALEVAGLGALVSGGVGAAIGAAFGSPEDFPVGFAPEPPFLCAPRPELARAPPTWAPPALAPPALAPPALAPPALPPLPPAMRAATVVAPLAEVRSAPFKVAPVIATLARGQSLSVAPTPNAGWRVVYLSDGRVGYIEDPQVVVNSP